MTVKIRWTINIHTTVDCPIVLQFDMMVHYASPKTAEFWKLTSGQIQDGGRRINFQSWSRYNSAADCSILLKFGTPVRYLSAEVRQGLKYAYPKVKRGVRPPVLNTVLKSL